MKKTILVILVFVLGILLVSCKPKKLASSNIDSLKIDVKKDEVKIMQLTDVHLTYGFDYLDKQSFKLIDKLIVSESPDIIIVTGDLFMTLFAKSVFKKFIKFIDAYDIPWSIIFGNHEMEFHSMDTIVSILLSAETNNLYFTLNKDLTPGKEHGYSNLRLEVFNGDKHLLNLYLLDSKQNRQDGTKDNRFPYDYLSKEQVNWYSNLVKEDIVQSLIYVHMPIMQFLEYDGPDRGEDSWPQAIDTGLYDSIIDPLIGNSKTLGVFVGHDHLNSFDFKLDNDNVMLAYGLTSGFNAYGTHDKGSRFVDYNFNLQDINSYLVKSKELK